MTDWTVWLVWHADGVLSPGGVSYAWWDGG